MRAPALTVRPREPGDLPACVTILAVTHADDGYPQRWPDDPEAWLTPAHPRGAWVAVRDGDVVGHVALAAVPDPAAGPLLAGTGLPASALGSVTRLFVSSAARGRGGAPPLLEAAAAAARAQGRRPVLDVFAQSRAAVRFYEGAGWAYLGSGYASWRTHAGERAYVHYYAAPEAAPGHPARASSPGTAHSRAGTARAHAPAVSRYREGG